MILVVGSRWDQHHVVHFHLADNLCCISRTLLSYFVVQEEVKHSSFRTVHSLDVCGSVGSYLLIQRQLCLL
jgi:hypothetical protein